MSTRRATTVGAQSRCAGQGGAKWLQLALPYQGEWAGRRWGGWGGTGDWESMRVGDVPDCLSLSVQSVRGHCQAAAARAALASAMVSSGSSRRICVFENPHVSNSAAHDKTRLRLESRRAVAVPLRVGPS